MPCILEADVSKKRCQKNWARLIRKIYEVNPLVCSKCNGQMRITRVQRTKVPFRQVFLSLPLSLRGKLPLNC